MTAIRALEAIQRHWLTATNLAVAVFVGLPFLFVPIIVNFPAGLIVYWITTNFWTFGQQVVVRKVAPPPQLAPAVAGGASQAVAEKAKKPPPPPRKKKRRR